MATKLDLKKNPYKHLYAPSTSTITQVDVPPLPFLMVDGTGDPNTSATYQHAVQALYSTAYTLKFMSKAEGIDFVVMPLEGLWWANDMDSAFAPDGDRSQWQWTAMILQPEHITAAMVTAAIESAKQKKDPSPLLDQVRLEVYHEGPAAQIMYTGPYAGEGPTISKLHAWIEEQDGFTLQGAKHHHEIYISDPGRTAPEKLKTVIRQPMRAV